MRLPRLLPLPIGVLLCAAILFATAASASAATFTVNRTATDAVDAAPGDGSCATGAGECTLRAAVQEANATAEPDTIVLPSGQVANLTLGAGGTGTPATGDLDVLHDLRVVASETGPATVDGGDVDRIFDVPAASPSIVLTLDRVTLRNGKVSAEQGGAIRTAGTLNLTRSRVTSSDAVFAGGVYTTGGAVATLFGGVSTIADSRLDGNSATSGGAVSNAASTVTVARSTIDGNSSRAGESGSGGAFQNYGKLDITNTTVTGNADNGGNGGGALITSSVNGTPGTGQVTISYSTLAGNTSGLGSAVRDLGGGTSFVKVKASLVLGDCAAVAPTSVAPHHNIGGGGTCGLNDATDAPAGTATLGALADNGGPTPTRALAPGAGTDGVDDIPAAQCDAPAVDQRGGKRPFGGACDVGAYEIGGLADVRLTGSVAPASVTAGQNVTYSYDVSSSGPDPATGVVLSDTLPAGVTFVSATSGCTGGSSGPVTCPLGTVAGGSTKAVSIVVRADVANAALTNTAQLSLDQNDPSPESLTLTSAVGPAPCGTPGGDACAIPPCGTAGAAACPQQGCANGGPDPCVEVPPIPPLALTRFGAAPARFRTTGGTAASRGTTFSLTLSREAKVTLAVKGPITRRRVCVRKEGKRTCHSKTKAPAAGSLVVDGTAGVNKVRFTGKLRRKALKPGRYSVTATASAGSEKKAAKAITVVVLKPKR